MKKWQIENQEKSKKSEISEKLFLVFLFPSFRFCPTTKIENSDLKISEKNFRDFRGFRVFDQAWIYVWADAWHWTIQVFKKQCFFLFINLDFIVFVSTNRLYLSFKGLNTKDPYTHCFNQPCFEKNTRFSRGNHHWCSVRKGVLRNFAKFTGNTCVAVSLNKVAVPGVTSFDSFNCWN